MGKINILSPLLSARIAAGEVIERPQSILRELLDNAIDSGATEIRVSIEGGGIESITVQDNGSGIDRDDLNLIGSRHATSKIHTNDDLYTINTLGFRGEALYSISAVSKLTIRTRSASTGIASSLIIDNGKRYPITEEGPNEGTIVTAENLFRDIPARRAFLKRSSTEAQLCRNLLVAKSLAFPNIRFTLTIDGALRLDWPIVENLKERSMYYFRHIGIFDADMQYLEYESDDFSLRIIAGNSSVKRSDRKEIKIYVNNRPVEEYSLVQAIVYGYGELLPGGSFPVAILFINDKSELVDFNIHPAKKEVKIRNIAEIHHAVTSILKNNIDREIPTIDALQTEMPFNEPIANSRKETFNDYIHQKSSSAAGKINKLKQEFKTDDEYVNEPSAAYIPANSNWIEKAKQLKETQQEILKKSQQQKACDENREKISFKYIGQAFNLFLIAEKDGELFLVDQHAAHERILYNEIIEQKTIQPLLMPISIEVDDLTDSFLDKHSHVYTSMGIMLSKKTKGSWEINALPAVCREIEGQITDFITTAKADEEELESKLFAIIACKAAIKAGDSIDRWSAEALLEKVFQLEVPACPHGRTFLIKISEAKLRELVGRTN